MASWMVIESVSPPLIVWGTVTSTVAVPPPYTALTVPLPVEVVESWTK